MEVGKLITHISKSAPMKAVFDEAQLALYGKALKLRNMTMHRWSSAEETIYRVLANFTAILRTYHIRSKRLELMTKKAELLEVYTLLRSINLLLKDLQGGSVTSGPQLIMRVNLLLRSDLALDKPLIVVDPAVVERKEEPAASGEGGSGPTLPRGHRAVAAADLTDVGTQSRKLLRDAISKRFVKNRYHSSGDCTKTDYLFDAAAMAHPGLVRMQWVDRMSDTVAHAKLVKGKIQDVILIMLEDLHFKGGGSGGGGEGESASTSNGRRYRTVAESGSTTSSDLAAVMSDDEDAVEAAVSAPLTSAAWAKEKLEEYLQWCGGRGDKVDTAKNLTWEGLPNWWLKSGSSIFPDVAVVFQALLAMPGGAASLERDFSIASNVLTVHRAQLDQAYVEMTMLLHMSMDKIPPISQIMELSARDANEALPRRLRNKEDFVKFLELDKAGVEVGEEENDDIVEENDPQATDKTRFSADDGGDDGDDVDDGYDDGGGGAQAMAVTEV